MTGIKTLPEDAKPDRRYWIDPGATAYQVSDHLAAAQYAKAESDEFDKPGPWTYEDMWRNGWVRVHTDSTSGVIWADGGRNMVPSMSQMRWLKEAARFLGGLRIANGTSAGKYLENTNPTKEFVEKLLDQNGKS